MVADRVAHRPAHRSVRTPRRDPPEAGADRSIEGAVAAVGDRPDHDPERRLRRAQAGGNGSTDLGRRE